MPSQSIILFISILFILSTICERLTNFVKLYVDSECPGLKQWLSTLFGIHGRINRRRLNENDEKLRELNILKVNIFFGFVTALIMDADLILMLSNLTNPGSTMGWQHSWKDFFANKTLYEDIFSVLLKILGWFLTGCFISLGSKFWHDLLDLLLEIKDAKNQINQETTTKLAAGDFGALDTEQQKQIIKDAINDKFDSWKGSYSGITGVSAAFKTVSGQKLPTRAIQFHVNSKGKGSAFVPDKIYHQGYFIPTDIIQVGKAKALRCLYPGDEDTIRKLGSSISRAGQVNKETTTGSICLKAYRYENGKKVYYLLSCFHVLFPDEMNSNYQTILSDGLYYSNGNNINNPEVVSPGTFCKQNSSWILAKATDGAMDDSMDAGLARLIDEQYLSASIYDLGEINDTYTPNKNDENVLNVKILGCRSGIHRGGILANDSTDKKTITYSFGDFEISNLLQIDGIGAQGGDSGAPVIDEQNRILGMVIAATDDGTTTFAVPIVSIMSKLDFSIVLANDVNT